MTLTPRLKRGPKRAVYKEVHSLHGHRNFYPDTGRRGRLARREIAEEITIAPTTFGANPVENLPPPPEERTASLADTPACTPYEVAPEVKDRERARKIVLKCWPPAVALGAVGKCGLGALRHCPA